MPGWDADLTKCRKPGDLPTAARKYVDRLGEILISRSRSSPSAPTGSDDPDGLKRVK